MTKNSKELAKYIDHTLLKPDATKEMIHKLCHEANEYGFFSVCLNPTFLNEAKAILSKDVALCTVIGFPLGANQIKTKVFETQNAIDLGATEIDMVINIGALKNSEENYIVDEISQVVEAAQNHVVKVIIETCLLSESEKIKACHLIEKANAHFIKTSTGFSHHGAKLEDIKLFKDHLSKGTKIKASGGIKNKEAAMEYIELGVHRIGTSSGIEIVTN